MRYDTPSFNGFSIAVAAGRNILTTDPTKGDSKFYDVSLNYEKTFGVTQVVAGLGVSQEDKSGGGKVERAIGSASVLFGNWVNVTMAAGEQKDGGKYTYGKPGHWTQFFSTGETAFGVDVYSSRDFLQKQTITGVIGDRGNFVGIGEVQKFDKMTLEAYASYRHYDLKADKAQFSDANVVLASVRAKF